MTTAGKFGAQDLNGNPFNYQQLVNPANTGPSNVIVNTTFVNRTGTANKARLALSSTALVPQTVSSAQGLYPITGNQTNSSASLETQQILTIGSSSSATNAYTTAPITVTATITGTNQLTCINTNTLSVGQPVVFASAIGGLQPNITYYILNILSNTNFTISNVWNGAIVSLVSQAANVLMYQSTANLLVGMPIHFHGVPFGGVSANFTYYVNTITSNTSFTVTQTPGSGTAFTLLTFAFGLVATMVAVPVTGTSYNPTINNPGLLNISNVVTSGFNSIQGLNVGSTIATTVSTVTAAVSSGGGTTVTYTLTGTALYPVGSSVTIAGITGGTGMTGTFTVTSSVAGTLIVSSTGSGSPSSYAGATATGGNCLITAPININYIYQGSFTGTVYPNPPFILCSATNTLTTGMPIIFNITSGGIVAGTVYYVSQIFSYTAFNISTIPGGPVFAFTANIGPTNMIAQQATTFIQVGQPIVFNGGGTYQASIANQAGINGQVFGNLIVNQTYYVLSASGVSFTVSATPGGTAVTLSNDGMNGTLIASGNFKIGQRYIVVNTSVQPPGAGANTAGTAFIATGPGTGTGYVMVAATSVASNAMTAGVTYAVALAGTGNFNASGAANTVAGTSGITLMGVTGATSSPAATNYGSIGNFTYSSPSLLAGASSLVYFFRSQGTTNGASDGIAVPINPMIVSSPSAALNTAPAISIASSSSVTNAYTTTTFTCQNTTASTGVITTSGNAFLLAIGQPVVFDLSFGNIIAGTVYYILNVTSGTTFQISATLNGSLFPLTTTSAITANMSLATTSLAVNQPIVFSGTVGGVTAGQVYYIQNLPSTTVTNASGWFTIPNLIQVSTIYGGPPLTLTTASSTMIGSILPVVPTINVRSSTAATSAIPYNYLGTHYGTCTATINTAPYEITVDSTSFLSVGQPVVFSTSTAVSYSVSNSVPNLALTGGAISTTNLTGATVYYVVSIDSLTSFQVSATYGGSPVALGASSATFYVYQTTGNLNVGQPIVLTGNASAIDANLNLNTTYYVSGILGLTTFSISNTIYGSPITFAGGTTNWNTVQIGPRPVMTISGTVTSGGVTMQTFPVTATQAITNLVTINTTYPLSVGMPVVFSATTGLMAANQLFYVASIANATQFTVSSTKGGPVYVQNTTTGISANLQQAATPLYINQPLVFFPTQASATSVANATLVPTGLTGMVYGYTVYISAFNSLVSFTISLAPNSSVPGATVSTAISLSTGGNANAFAFLPMTNNVISNFAYQTAGISVSATTATAPYLLTCTSTSTFSVGQPVQFDSAAGGLVPNTTYYVSSIPSSTTFNVSSVPFGQVVVTTATTPSANTFNVYQSTAGLTAGSAVQFYSSGSTFGLPSSIGYSTTIAGAFSSLSPAAMTFYVQSVPSFNTVILTLINASPASFGGNNTGSLTGIKGIGMLPLGLGTFTLGVPASGAQTGTMNLMTISPVPPITTFQSTVGATAINGYFTTQPLPITAATVAGNLISVPSTSSLFQGMPVVFSGSVGGVITTNVVYYVATIPSSTTFTVASTFNNAFIGTTITLSSSSFTGNVNMCTLFLQPNQPIIFYGGAAGGNIGGVSTGVTYYINQVVTSTSFQISQYVNNVPTVPTATVNIFAAGVTGPYRQSNIAATTASSQTFNLTGFTMAGTQSTNGTNMLIANNTFALYPGMPVTVSGGSGVLAAAQIYYVTSIVDEHRFTVSLAPPAQYGSPNTVGYIPTGPGTIIYQTPNGTTLPVTTQLTGSVTMYQSMSKLQLNQPVIFYGNLGGQTLASNALVIGRTYTIIVLGTAAANWSTASTGLTTAAIGTVFTATSTTNGQTDGVVYSGILNTNAVLLPGQIYYVSSVTNAGIGNNAFTVSAAPTYAGVNITPYLATSVTGGVAADVVFTVTTGGAGFPYTLVNGLAITVTGTSTGVSFTGGGTTAPNRTLYTVAVSGATFKLALTPGGTPLQNGVATLTFGGWTLTLNGINPNVAVNLTSAGSAALGVSDVSAVNYAMTMVPLMSNVTASNIFQAQPLPIQSVAVTTAVCTTGVLTVAYATSINTNLITCLSTTGLTVGMPIAFSATLGTIASATTYYVLSVNSPTTFTVATTWGGQVLIMINAYNYSYVQASTANLTLGQPLVFTGSVFGGIIAYNTYYVATVPSATTFTLANSLGSAISTAGTPTVIITTAAAGYMLAYPATGSTTTTGAVVGGESTGAFGSSTYGLIIGTQYMITSIGSTNWTTYGAATNTVGTIFTATAQGAAYGAGSFQIGAGTGTAIELVGLMGNMNAPIAANPPAIFVGPTITVTGINGTQLYTPGNTNFLAVNQAVVFTGYTFISGITAGLTYFIQSIVSSNVFTLSATSGGGVLTFTTGSNTLTMQILNSMGTSLVPYQTYYTQSTPNPIAWSISSTTVQTPSITISSVATGTTITTGSYNVVAVSAVGNLITAGTTVGLVVGQPIIFPSSVLGNIITNTVYYVQTIYSPIQFSISTTATGQAFNPGTATGNVTMQIATANLVVGQQISFSGSVGASGLVVGTNYYIQSLNANNYTFTVASLVGGSALSWTSTTFTTNSVTGNFIINAIPLTTSTSSTVGYQSNILTLATGSSTQYLLPNQPVVFTNTSGVNWSGLNTMYSVASATVPAVSSAYVVTTVTTSTNVITINYVTSNNGTKTATTLTTGAFPALTLNQPVVFAGANVDNLVINQTYYIQSITAATGITVSLTPGGAAVSIGSNTSPTAGTVLMIPAYYVKAVTSSNTLQVSATPGGPAVVIPTTYATGTNVVSLTPLPLNTDFIYGDVAVAAQTQVTQNGILVPPNTYLYASAGLTVFGSGTGASATGMNVIAIGVQDLV